MAVYSVSRDDALHNDLPEPVLEPTGAELADCVTMVANALREAAQHLDDLARELFSAQLAYLVRRD